MANQGRGNHGGRPLYVFNRRPRIKHRRRVKQVLPTDQPSLEARDAMSQAGRNVIANKEASRSRVKEGKDQRSLLPSAEMAESNAGRNSILNRTFVETAEAQRNKKVVTDLQTHRNQKDQGLSKQVIRINEVRNHAKCIHLDFAAKPCQGSQLDRNEFKKVLDGRTSRMQLERTPFKGVETSALSPPLTVPQPTEPIQSNLKRISLSDRCFDAFAPDFSEIKCTTTGVSELIQSRASQNQNMTADQQSHQNEQYLSKELRMTGSSNHAGFHFSKDFAKSNYVEKIPEQSALTLSSSPESLDARPSRPPVNSTPNRILKKSCSTGIVGGSNSEQNGLPGDLKLSPIRTVTFRDLAAISQEESQNKVLLPETSARISGSSNYERSLLQKNCFNSKLLNPSKNENKYSGMYVEPPTFLLDTAGSRRPISEPFKQSRSHSLVVIEDLAQPLPKPFQNEDKSLDTESSCTVTDAPNCGSTGSLSSSVDIKDADAPPLFLYSAGKSILKNNSTAGPTFVASNNSDRNGFEDASFCTLSEISSISESSVSEQQSQQNIQSSAKMTTISESANRTRYLPQNNYAGKLRAQKSSGCCSSTQESSRSQVDTNSKAHGRSSSDVIQATSTHVHTISRGHPGDQFNLSHPEVRSDRISRQQREPKARTSLRTNPDFTQLSANKLMRQIETDSNPELTSVLKKESLNSSPEVYDPDPRPQPHGSTGKGILKNVPSVSLCCASDTSRLQELLSTAFISNTTPNSTLATSQIMVSGQQLNQSEHTFSKKATINEDGNHTRYLLLKNFDPKPLKRRATQVHVPTKSSSASNSNRATRHPQVSRSQPDTTTGLRQEHRASSETPGNNTPQMRTPNKDLNRSTRSDSVDFNSVGFVNKLMRHIERDENRELVSILLRDTVGDIICEEMCKGENYRKCFQNASTKLNDAQLFKVVEVILGPNVVNKLMRHIETDSNRELVSVLSRDPGGQMICKEVMKKSDIQRLNSIFLNLSEKLSSAELFTVAESVLFEKVDSITNAYKLSSGVEMNKAGFLATLFQLLDEAAKDLPLTPGGTGKGGRRKVHCSSPSSMQKSFISKLALNIAKRNDETLRILSEERDHRKSVTEHLQDFNDLLSNNFGGAGEVQWNDEMLKEAMLAANKLIEIIPGLLKFNAPGSSSYSVIPGSTHVHTLSNGHTGDGGQCDLSQPEDRPRRVNCHPREAEPRISTSRNFFHRPNLSSRTDSLDFNSVGVVSKLIRHVEKDEEREFVGILLRGKGGDIFLEEILKRDFQNRLSRISNSLSDNDLFKVAEGLLGPKVNSITRAAVLSTEFLQSSPQVNVNEGFLNNIFELLGEATNDLDPNVPMAFQQGSLPDLQKLIFRKLALNIVKKDPEALEILKDEFVPKRSRLEQLQDFQDLIENNFGDASSLDDEVMLQFKRISNKLFEIIPERPVSKYNT